MNQTNNKARFSNRTSNAGSVSSNLILPTANTAQIYIDFDGTLTQTDVIDQLVSGFAVNDSWKEIEKLWALQEIGSAQCLREELALVRISDADLEAFVASIQLDAGTVDLFKLITSLEIPVTVVSDGLDYFIHSMIDPLKIPGVQIRCNRMVRDGASIGVEFPNQQLDCQVAAGHCKCASTRAVAAPGRSSIYIGDGQSDLCAARHASVVFAKNALADLLAREGKLFYPFETLKDVANALSAAWLA